VHFTLKICNGIIVLINHTLC